MLAAGGCSSTTVLHELGEADCLDQGGGDLKFPDVGGHRVCDPYLQCMSH